MNKWHVNFPLKKCLERLGSRVLRALVFGERYGGKVKKEARVADLFERSAEVKGAGG